MNVIVNYQCGGVDNIAVTLMKPRQNGVHFADEIYKLIILYEMYEILMRVSLKFVSQGNSGSVNLCHT